MVERKTKTLKVRCVSDKYGNFRYNKIYLAEAMSRHIGGEKLYSNYRITDEDGDYYTIQSKDLGKIFLIVPEL